MLYQTCVEGNERPGSIWGRRLTFVEVAMLARDDILQRIELFVGKLNFKKYREFVYVFNKNIHLLKTRDSIFNLFKPSS
jgi:hypothetical protein